MKKTVQELAVNVRERMQPRRVWPRILLAFVGTATLLAFLVFFVAIIYNGIYETRVYPGVFVSNYSVGALEPHEVKAFIENINNRLAKEGIPVLAVDGASVEHKIIIFSIN